MLSPSPNMYHKPRNKCQQRSTTKSAGKYPTSVPNQNWKFYLQTNARDAWISWICISKVIDRLAEKVLVCIAKRWNKLQYMVKYWGSILFVFSKPLALDMDSGIFWFASHLTSTQICFICRDDFLGRVIATPDMLIHSYVIEFELCLRETMWQYFLLRTHFWAGVDSDPTTFYVLAVLIESWHPSHHCSKGKLFKPLLEKCCSLIWLSFFFALGPRSYIFPFVRSMFSHMTTPSTPVF
jgi:hypothetical protein